MIDFRKAFNNFLDVIFPFGVTCLFCGEEIEENEKYGLCEDCRKKLNRVKESYAKYDGAEVYSSCRYEDATRSIILDAKDGDRPELTRVMAFYIAEVYSKENLGCDCIAYVPCSKKNYGKRGYDHMKICAGFLSDELGLPVLKGLKRIGGKRDQTEVSLRERHENVKGKFVYRGEKLDGKKVLLIDDIVTTGATLSECAAALASAQPASTVCVTFARAESSYGGAERTG